MKKLTEDQEQEIIAFYLIPNSAKAVYKTFGIGLCRLRKLLIKYNVSEHSAELTEQISKNYIKQTCLKKYGVESPNQVEEIKAKMFATKLERYDNPTFVNPEKAKRTNLVKYGVPNAMQVKEVQEKQKQTCILKYGNSCALQNTIIQEKIKQTNLQRYGVQDSRKAKQKIEKTIATLKNRTPEQKAITKNKTQQTCLTKFGVINFSQTVAAQKARKPKYCYENETFDSKTELCFWLYYKAHGLNIRRNTTIKFAYSFNDKIYYYFPDFIINDQLIEIKGDQFLKSDGTWQNPYDHKSDAKYEAKHKCAIANNVKIIYSSVCKKYINWAKTNYNLDIYKIKS